MVDFHESTIDFYPVIEVNGWLRISSQPLTPSTIDFYKSTIDFQESTIDFQESTIDFHKLNIVGNGIIRQSTLIRGFFKNTLKRRQKGQFFVLGGFRLWRTRIRRNFSILTSGSLYTALTLIQGNFQKHPKTSPKGPIFCTRGFSVMENTNPKEFSILTSGFLYTALTLIQGNFSKTP